MRKIQRILHLLVWLQFTYAGALVQPPFKEVPEPSKETVEPKKMDFLAQVETVSKALFPPAIPPVIPPSTEVKKSPDASSSSGSKKEITINFNNVGMIEYIRFVSGVINKNFVFDEEDLQFNVTIISEEPTTIENLMAALMQELRVRDLFLIEEGNNILIHRNQKVRSPATVVANDQEMKNSKAEIVTRVFRLNTLDPNKAADIIKPILSDDALVEVLKDSNNLVITDFLPNVAKIAQLIHSLDAPNSGVTVGQYVVRNAFVDTLVDLATKILQPFAQGNPFILVPHQATNSVFIVSNAFIVEKSLAILENLDLNDGKTKVFSLDRLKSSGLLGPGGQGEGEGEGEGGEGAEGSGGAGPGGRGRGKGGRFGPNGELEGEEGGFGPGGGPGGLFPGGIGNEGLQGLPYGESSLFAPGGISSTSRWLPEIPSGRIERTLFYIYKLKYRKGDQLEVTLRKISASLEATGTANTDLVGAINSSQWIESSNSLIFTGTHAALERVKELITEIDLPLRQVFIEMLILDTTISDSLSYGVDWGSRFGGGNTSGGESFLGLGSSLDASLNATRTGNAAAAQTATGLLPSIAGLVGTDGFSLGVIGRHLTHNGTQFNTIGALIKAIHNDTKTNIILNPKIITEDNNPAEVFVGATDRYKTQSISNDQGSVITNNFQFIDVGTTLRVTPLIGNNGIITLDILEEVTNDSGAANTTTSNPSVVDVNLVPVLSKSRTTTRFHVPDGFFVVMSGFVSDTETRVVNRIPCLGGVPFLGGISKQKSNRDDKRTFMIFIRPLIVDTEDELENVTKRQQDVFREKCKFRRSWNYEIDEALDFFNIKSTDPDLTDNHKK